MKPWPDLRSFVAHLESIGELKRITVEVDPKFELTSTNGNGK